MKKNFYLLLLLVAFGTIAAKAQTYSYFKSTGITGPYTQYDLNGYGTAILGGDNNGATNDKLSALQKLPFAFNFYGKQVTGYYASDNGYITFDQNASTSVSKNDSLPSSKDAAPHNSIFAFWTNLMLPQTVSTNTAYYKYSVNSYTIGTAPNRIHVIQWFGAAASNAGSVSDYSQSIFFSIRLYECGDFDIVQDYKSPSAPAFAATIGCLNNDGTAGTMVAGSPKSDFANFNANAAPAGQAVVYTFIGSQSKFDLSLNSVNNIGSSYATGASINVAGTIQNMGYDTINSFSVRYQVDNNPIQSIPFSFAQLAPNQTVTYDFSSVATYTVSAGYHTLKVWIKDSSLNGKNPDARPCNNTITMHFSGRTGTSTVKMTPLLEYFTGAWCGFCPSGELAAEGVIGKYPEAPVVAIHGPLAYGAINDKMLVNASGPITSNFGTGFPTGTFSRTPINAGGTVGISFVAGYPYAKQSWLPYYDAVNKAYSPVNVTSTVTYDSTHQTADVSVTANFSDYPQAGQQRITLYVVEDNVEGHGQGWDQHIYNGPYEDTTSSFYHYKGAMADPNSAGAYFLPNFIHHRVLRAILSSDNAPQSPYSPTWGDSGIIPMYPDLNKDYTAKYTGIDVSIYNPKNVIFIAFVDNFDLTSYGFLNTGNANVLNSTTSKRLITTGISEKTKESSFVSVFPNPAKDQFYSVVKFAQPTRVSFELYNMLGQVVMNVPAELRPAGENTVQFNTYNLAPGVYNLNMITPSGTSTERVIISR